MTDSKTDERGALFVTADSEDPRFNQPYVDVREWRDEPADAPVFPGGITTQSGGAAPLKARHLYVHGGFTGTDAKFSFCFPPEEEYQGRFFQATHQLLAGEEATARNVGFALASGGYSVQTNMGGRDNPRSAEESAFGQADTTIRGYRVNAEAAKYSRVVAAEIYGPHRTYGYLYGGSGGAYQTVTSAEMTTGVWDGFVPYVMGSPQSIPNCFTVRVNALRVLKDKWPSIIDAIEPGGSGDPYAGLNDEERTALEEATRTGFPPGAWFNYVPQGGGPLVLVASYVPVLDPTYLDDFWSKPGYLGTDPTSSVGAARIQHEATVVEVVPGQNQLKLSSVPTGDLAGADVIITSGAAAGKTVSLGRIASDGKGHVGLVFEPVGDTIDVMADPSRRRQHGGRRRGPDRQLEVPRPADLPPSPIPAGQSRLRLPRRLRLLPQPRRHAEVPPARCGHRRRRDPRRHRSDPDRSLQREDDRGGVPARRGRSALASRLVRERRSRPSRDRTSTTSTGSGTSTTRTTPTRRRSRWRPTPSPTRARCTTRCAS